MIEKLLPTPKHPEETIKRSVMKTVIYRVIIVILDFLCVYIFTGKAEIAVGFMLVSNIYTSAVYFFNERIWDRIKWGQISYKKASK